MSNSFDGVWFKGARVGAVSRIVDDENVEFILGDKSRADILELIAPTVDLLERNFGRVLRFFCYGGPNETNGGNGK